ncbi:MAG: alpha/beta hydrolase [Acidimicrobiia bacterium]|nr:alpha/beta hydrolase [Acidimicrobiia bacterium]
MSNDRVPRWQTMSDEERERQYTPSTMLDGPLAPYLDAYARRSAEAYERVDRVETIRYGPGAANTVDLALPAATTVGGTTAPDGLLPLHVYIHGGYWQLLSKRESFFLAPDCVARGMAFAAVDYTLAPAATLDEIVDECVTALTALHAVAPDHGVDPDSMVVSGSSAGGHLTAMTALKLPPDQRPAAVIPVSGVFELEPLIGTSINDAVGLDVERARANSPLLHDLGNFPPSVVAFGENEPDEFKRQSRALVDRLLAANRPSVEVEVTGRNHFDIVHDIITDLVPLLPGAPPTPDHEPDLPTRTEP